MNTQKTISQFAHIRSPLVKTFCFLILFISSALAQEFGIHNFNNTKINDLLKNMQSENHNKADSSKPTSVTSATTSDQQFLNRDPLSDAAFANMTRSLLPLSREQIKTLHYLFDQTQQATAEMPGIPPKPTSTSLIVNLSPGATPPVVRLQQGFVSALVFVDATGAAWPIRNYDLGDPKNFNIQWDKKSHVLMLQALSAYQHGNLAVSLEGLDTPVMITLMPGQRAIDYRIDFRIPKIGPNPNLVLEGLPAVENSELINVLDGIPPTGARSLMVHGGGEDCQAWLLNGSLYLRTRMTLLSPAFISIMSSADGTHAYQLQTTPVLLVMSRGKTIKLKIEGL